MTMGFGFCATCGAPRTAADQKFCATCGSTLTAPPPPVSAPPEVAPPPPYAGQPPVAPPPVAPQPAAAPPAAWPTPPALQYPPTYVAGPPPSYTDSPSFAPPVARAATGVATGVATGAGGGILHAILLIPTALVTHLLGRILITLGSILLIVALVVSYLGIAQVPVLSSAFGMDKARDLHMVKDSAALNAFTDKWGIELPSPTANYTLGSKHHYSGTVQVDDTISESALAALPEYSAPNSHISQIQFRVHEGSMELSAFVNVPGYPASGPVYTKFAISATSSRTVALDFSELDFGRIGVPGNVVDTAKTTIEAYLNKKIIETGVTIDTLELHEGAIRFKGTWPKTITADPPKTTIAPRAGTY